HERRGRGTPGGVAGPRPRRPAGWGDTCPPPARPTGRLAGDGRQSSRVTDYTVGRSGTREVVSQCRAALGASGICVDRRFLPTVAIRRLATALAQEPPSLLGHILDIAFVAPPPPAAAPLARSSTRHCETTSRHSHRIVCCRCPGQSSSPARSASSARR